MELDINALDLLPAPEDTRLMGCTFTCAVTCRTSDTCYRTQG
ncbi:ALQxL family class IV lanthipeptide [Sphaerisporangium viridialbum]